MPYSYQRSYTRFPLEAQAVIKTEKAGNIPTMLTDISAGGASLLTIAPLKELEKVEVSVRSCFFFSKGLRKEAKVAWCKKSGYDLWRIGLDFGIDNLVNFS